MSTRALLAAAAWGLACVVGVVSLVLPARRARPVPANLAAGAELRVSAPDLALGGGLVNVGVSVVPPWTRGTPAGRSALVTRPGTAPHPRGDFERVDEAEGWVRWSAGGAEPAVPSRIELETRLGGARVEIVRPDGSSRVCDGWEFGRWRCGPSAWNYVGPASVTVRDREQRCIWAHPTDEGTVRITFEDLPRAVSLSGRHMLADVSTQSPEDGLVHFAVFVDGEETLTREQGLRRGLNSFRASLPGEGGPMTLAVEVSAETVSQRHFCFDITLRDVVGAAP